MLSKLPPKGEEDLSLAWSAAAWLESLRARIPKNAASNAKPGEANSQDEQLKADSMDTETGRLGLIVDALARSLLKHAPAQYELEGELDRMRRLAHVDRDTLRECLTAACVELTDSLLSELKALGDNAEGTSAEENKFAGLVPLRFAGLDVFYGGLESLVGAPEPNFQTEGGAKQEWQFQRAMEYEHIHGTDCKREFTTGNYGITTTSEKEWQFVVARNQELPVEGLQCSHPRNFVLLAELEEQMAKHNTRLKGLGQTEMIRAELVGGRLYTGPVFTKYNVVLRALQVEDNELRKRFLTLCGLEGSAEHYDQIALRVNPVPGAVAGQPSSCAQAWERAAEGANKYTTTLHAINSCIIKTSKLTAATKVYRGISDMALPREFLQPNEFGVRGGVEAAFMSTTTDRSVAIGYAGKSDAGVVFEVQMGMIDRGANIGWLSQYPHEKEILFGPLSGLEVVAVRTSGMLVVVEAKLSVNLSALTLEQVVAKRQKVVRDMCLQLELGVEHGIAKDAGGAWTKFFESSALNKRRTLEFLRSWLCSHQDLEAEYYNDDASLGHVIEETVHAAKCVAAWPSKFAHLPLEWKAPLGEGKAMGSDKRHQAQEGDDFVLAIDQRAHSCVEGVAALLLARDGPRTLEVKDAALSVPEVVTVVEAVHHSSSRSSLKRLVLSGNHCDVRGARALARLLQKTTAIRELELDNAKLTFRRNYSGFQEFCAVLGVNTILRLLSLSGNEMGDQGAQHLASALEKNRTLTTINLNNNKVGAEGAQHLGSALEKNRTLATLNLSSNKMGAEGAQRMALAIEKNGTLMTLDLNRNGTGDKGAQHLASALEKNRTLTTLDLSDNNIGAEGAQHLASVVEKNGTLTTINLSGIRSVERLLVALLVLGTLIYPLHLVVDDWHSPSSPDTAMATKSTNITWHEGNVSRDERWAALGVSGATLWFTGLSASGKSTIASALEQVLVQRKINSYRLDGDNIRFGLNKNLGFSPEDRTENIRRIGEVAKLFADSGAVTITSFISPYQAGRDAARTVHQDAGLKFYEVWVNTPLAVCEERDPKGLYKKARAGEIKGFTGIDAPFEEPANAELVLSTADHSVDECVQQCIDFLKKEGIISADA